LNKKAYTFFLKKNRPRNPVAKTLNFFTPKVVPDKKKYDRKKINRHFQISDGDS
jgi:hypothetical protein